MIYLDNGATSFRKPPGVARAVGEAMARCANPGRGGYPAAMEAAETVFRCRETAGHFFDCDPEQVVFTGNCTQGLNIAIRTLVKPGGKVLVSGFEHNAVTRPLHGLGAEVLVAGRKLFDWENTLEEWEKALKKAPEAAVFTHVSNVFGYILPVEEMAALCRKWSVPFIVDAAQSAGSLPVSLRGLGAEFIAMPGHKGLLGPQGTGLLLCGSLPEPLLMGGTGSDSIRQEMPEFLPGSRRTCAPAPTMCRASRDWRQGCGICAGWASAASTAGRRPRPGGVPGDWKSWGCGSGGGTIRRGPYPSCRGRTVRRRPGSWPVRASPSGRGSTARPWPMRAPEPWTRGPSGSASATMRRLFRQPPC